MTEIMVPMVLSILTISLLIVIAGMAYLFIERNTDGWYFIGFGLVLTVIQILVILSIYYLKLDKDLQALAQSIRDRRKMPIQSSF